MLLPYIQVDVQFMRHRLPVLALRLGVTQAEAMLAVLNLWDWALSRVGPSSEDAAVDAEIERAALVTENEGDSPEQQIAWGARFQGDAAAFAKALTNSAVGLLERVEDGYRVRGLVDRYANAAASGANRKRLDAARKLLTRARWRRDEKTKGWVDPTNGAVVLDTLPAAALQRQRTARTPRAPRSAQPGANAAILEASPPVPPPPPPILVPTTTKPPRKRRAPTPKPDPATADAAPPESEPSTYAAANAALHEAFQRARGVPYRFDGGRDGKALKLLLWGTDKPTAEQKTSIPINSIEEIVHRFRIALGWRGFPECSSIHALHTNWNTYTEAQGTKTTPPPRDIRRGVVRAETQTHSSATGEVSI